MQRVRIHETDGDVAEGVEYSDGVIVVRWPNPDSHAHMWISREALEADEQFAGARFEWLDRETSALYLPLRIRVGDGEPIGLEVLVADIEEAERPELANLLRLVADVIAPDDVAQWLRELIHVVYGMARGEHLGTAPTLVPGHADEALRQVPESVKAAACMPRKDA